MKGPWTRFIHWLRPARATVDDEVADEYIISQWEQGGQTRGAGAAEAYHIGPQHGVRVAPVPATPDSTVTVAYSGLLAKESAGMIFLHWGVGPGPWQNVQEVPMMQQQEDGTWIARLRTPKEGGSLEFCFHDGAGNWDNNNGLNWSVTVLSPKASRTH